MNGQSGKISQKKEAVHLKLQDFIAIPQCFCMLAPYSLLYRATIIKKRAMMQRISSLPENMVGFRAVGEITKNDFDQVVLPEVKEIVEKTGQLNYLLVIDTSLEKFSTGAWIKDAILGVKNLTKWHRAAIVSDSASIKKFTDFFSILMPGEFKGFDHENLQEAIDWTSSVETVSVKDSK